MQEVFSDRESALVGYYQSVLESAGIPSFIRSLNSGYTMGGWSTPTLCVMNESDYERAVAVLAEAGAGQRSTAPNWRCTNCQEDVPGTFDICWQCHSPRPVSI